MNVLHLVSSGGMFGAERVILNLASQSNDMACWVGCLYNQHNPHLEIIDEAKASGLKTVIFESRGQADFRTAGQIRKFLNENKIDFLHTHNYKSDILGFLATRLIRTQWVATNHVWHSTDRKLRFYEAVDAAVLKSAKMVFTVSQEIKDDLLTKGFSAEKLHVISNGITISRFKRGALRDTLRKSWGIAEKDVLLSMTGRLAPEKGHEILFKALTQVVIKHPYVKCLVTGDGPLRNYLEDAVRKMNLSGHVIFAGIRKDMPDVYSACDIMINSSFIEGLPMTVLEGMASHLPLIVTNVGGLPQAIRNNENGLLLNPGDPESLAKAILELIGDASKRKRLADQAYKDVCEYFSDQRMAEDYKKYYKELLK